VGALVVARGTFDLCGESWVIDGSGHVYHEFFQVGGSVGRGGVVPISNLSCASWGGCLHCGVQSFRLDRGLLAIATLYDVPPIEFRSG